MALQTIPGRGPYLPEPAPFTLPPAYTASTAMVATGDKTAWIGRVWNKERTTKSIRRVGFLLGTITKAGGSGMTVSLQDPLGNTGPVEQPDGTQDQTVSIANGDAAFVTNGWYRTGAFNADRSVAFGEELAVVLEYDGSGRLGSDSITVRNAGATVRTQSAVSTFIASTWAASAVVPNIVLEFSDGTFGTLDGGFPCSALTLLAVNSGTTPDEYCLEGPLAFPCKVDGVWAVTGVAANTRDFSLILYDGTSAMTGGTVSIDANKTQTLAGAMLTLPFSQEITLAANHTYRLAIRPDTAGSINVYYFDVADANHFQAHALGIGWVLNSRTDAGAWGTATTTRRPLVGLRISALDDGVQVGGGLLAQRGFTGGYPA